jgi:hypothetical protein
MERTNSTRPALGADIVPPPPSFGPVRMNEEAKQTLVRGLRGEHDPHAGPKSMNEQARLDLEAELRKSGRHQRRRGKKGGSFIEKAYTLGRSGSSGRPSPGDPPPTRLRPLAPAFHKDALPCEDRQAASDQVLGSTHFAGSILVQREPSYLEPTTVASCSTLQYPGSGCLPPEVQCVWPEVPPLAATTQCSIPYGSGYPPMPENTVLGSLALTRVLSGASEDQYSFSIRRWLKEPFYPIDYHPVEDRSDGSVPEDPFESQASGYSRDPPQSQTFRGSGY